MDTIKPKGSFKLLCACLTLVIVLGAFSGCAARELSPSRRALREVGTVGEYSVPYEELYFLASNYYEEGMSEEELYALISENIVTNYAILTLCREKGVEYDQKQLKKDVKAYVENIIKTDFITRKNYLSALRDSGMTDHYVRYTAEVDLLYAKLPTALTLKGELLNEEDTVCAYVEENFVRTWHFMIANNEGDDVEQNRKNAEDALSQLKDGSVTMFKLIGGALNEDLLIPGDGYVFGRGAMETEYENAAFALEIGEYSDVISTRGELSNGEYVDCYYVIQRLPLEEDYIKQNYASIYEGYADAAVSQMLEEVKARLTFVPNEYFSSLSLTALEPVSIGTDTVAITVVVCVVSVSAVTAATAALLIKRFKKNTAKRLAAAKQSKVK